MEACFLYFGPFLHSSRGKKEIKTLAKNGVNVTVLAYAGKSFRSNKKDLGQADYNVIRYEIPDSRFKIIRVTSLVGFILWMIKKAIRFEVIHIHSPWLLPIAWVVRLLRRMFYRKRAKVIYDCHELEFDKAGLSNFGRMMIVFFENYFIRSCDHVITVTQGINDRYSEKYGISHNKVIMNLPFHKSVSVNSKLRDQNDIGHDKTIFIYAGRLCEGRGIKEWVEACSKLNHLDVVFVMVGYGPMETWCREQAAQFENVYFNEVIPQEELIEYITAADFGVNTPPLSCDSRILAMPNKLFEYMMAGLAVVVCDNSTRAEYVKHNQCGVVSQSSSVDCIVNVIKEALLLDKGPLRKKSLELSRTYSWESQETLLLAMYGIKVLNHAQGYR